MLKAIKQGVFKADDEEEGSVFESNQSMKDNEE